MTFDRLRGAQIAHQGTFLWDPTAAVPCSELVRLLAMKSSGYVASWCAQLAAAKCLLCSQRS